MFSPTSKETASDVNAWNNDKPKKQLKDIVSGLERQREKRKLKNSGDVSHYYYKKKMEINQEVRRQRESVDFQKTLLMKKGLNKEFIEEYKIMQMSKHFERRSKNPNLLRNKE